jgi:uncharacterized tellurite resistance protein B-like protein
MLFFIIFGTRGITITKEDGMFHCPSCTSSQGYRFRTVRRFFTLFFIPLIPLDKVGEYVECDRCSNTFYPRVLDQVLPDDKFNAVYEEVMQNTLVKMMLADGKIEDSEKYMVLAILNKFGSSEIQIDALDGIIAKAKNDSRTIVDYLKQIKASLNENGKELIVRSAILVSMADGVMDDAERSLILRISRILEFSDNRTNELINSSLTKEAQ